MINQVTLLSAEYLVFWLGYPKEPTVVLVAFDLVLVSTEKDLPEENIRKYGNIGVADCNSFNK